MICKERPMPGVTEGPVWTDRSMVRVPKAEGRLTGMSKRPVRHDRLVVRVTEAEERPVPGMTEGPVRHDRPVVRITEAEGRVNDYRCPEVMTDEEPRKRDPEPD